jgi:putative peptidoglycan lipid II flippase
MKPLGVLGVVIGAVVAGWVETIALGFRIRDRIGGLGLHHLRAGAAFGAGALSCGAGMLAKWAIPDSFANQTIATLPLGPALSLAAFGAVFAVAAPAFGLVKLGSILRRKR